MWKMNINLTDETIVFIMAEFGTLLAHKYMQVFRRFLDDWFIYHG